MPYIFKTLLLRGKKLRRIFLLTILVVLAVFLCIQLDVPERVVDVVGQEEGQERLVPIYFVETEENKIAISFDASWGAEKTPLILETLRKNDIKTTFFLTGFWIDKYPEMVKTIVEEGHELGNHTYSHPHLNRLGEEEIGKEIERVHKMLKDLTDQEAHLFRPPFGEYSNKVINVLESKGYKTIQWSVDSLDWKDLSKEEIATRVVDQLHKGAIVLFHNNGKYTAEALPDIIAEAEEKGYSIVPISELIYQEDYYIDNNTGAQIKKP